MNTTIQTQKNGHKNHNDNQQQTKAKVPKPQGELEEKADSDHMIKQTGGGD